LTGKVWALLVVFALCWASVDASPRAMAADASRSLSPEMSAALDQTKGLLVGGELEQALRVAVEQSQRSDLTAYETYVINSLVASIFINLQEFGAGARALEAAIASEQLPEKDVPNQIKAVAALYYNGNEYENAVAACERYFEFVGNEKDIQILVMIAQAQYVLKDFKTAITRVQNAITEAEATGEDVDKRWILLWIASEYEMGNAEGLKVALSEFSRRFPDANYYLEWRLHPLLKDKPPVEM